MDWEGSLGFLKVQYVFTIQAPFSHKMIPHNAISEANKLITYVRLQNTVWMKSVYYSVEAELIMDHSGEE